MSPPGAPGIWCHETCAKHTVPKNINKNGADVYRAQRIRKPGWVPPVEYSTAGKMLKAGSEPRLGWWWEGGEVVTVLHAFFLLPPFPVGFQTLSKGMFQSVVLHSSKWRVSHTGGAGAGPLWKSCRSQQRQP